MRARYGVAIVSLTFDLLSAALIAVPCVIYVPSQIDPRYNGTRLYVSQIQPAGPPCYFLPISRNVVDISCASLNDFIVPWYVTPSSTWRSNNVVITSKRHFDVITSKCHFDVITTSLLRNVLTGTSWNFVSNRSGKGLSDGYRPRLYRCPSTYHQWGSVRGYSA